MNKKVSMGKKIAKARRDAGLTQADVADKLNISYQAVSLWETDKSVPDMYNLMELAKLLGVSVSSLVEDRDGYTFKTNKNIYDWQHMASFVRHTSRAKGYENALKALDFAIMAHDGQTRKKSDIPYIYHPLNLACHALSMGIVEDDIIAACMLHDVVEDCGKELQDLPVDDTVKHLVRLLTKERVPEDRREEALRLYYAGRFRASSRNTIGRPCGLFIPL